MTGGIDLNIAPVLETDRLVLRGHTRADCVDCVRLWSDPAVVRFIGDAQILDEEAVWSRLLRYAGHWALMGYGYWCVRERANGNFVGDIGFANLKRAMEPSLGDAPEIGWVVAVPAQGRGLAAEAVAAALAWADTRLLAPETVCIIDPQHTRSISLARKAGYRQIGPAQYKGRNITIFSRLRRSSVAQLNEMLGTC